MKDATQLTGSPLVDHSDNTKKKKKRKEKKEKSVQETDGGEIGAPPPTEPQPIASTSVTVDSAMMVRIHKLII